MTSKIRKTYAAFDAVMKDEWQSLKSLTKQAWTLINENYSKRRERQRSENMNNINEDKNT